MPRRFRKQFLYGLGFLIFWIVAIGGPYFLLKPAPSCVDHTQNQGEGGIDCGGPCAVACIPRTLREIEVLDTRMIVNDATHGSLIGEIRNGNLDWAAKSFDYIFNIYDDVGKFLQSSKGTSFIYAGEVTYLALPNLEFPKVGHNTKLEIQSSSVEWVPSSEFPRPQFQYPQNLSPTITSQGIEIRGNVTNKDTLVFPRITLIAILFGVSQEPIGVSQTVIENLAPNDTSPFVIYHPPLTGLKGLTELYISAFRP